MTLQAVAKSPDFPSPSADYSEEFEAGNVKGVTAKTDQMLMMPIEDIVIKPGYNVRVRNAAYEQVVEEIKNSIIENGFYKHKALPVFIAKEDGRDVAILIGGFRRLEAANRAIDEGLKLAAIPVIPSRPTVNSGDLQVQIIVDNTGAPLTQWEMSVAIKRLINLNWTEEEIGRAISRSALQVKNLLILQSMPSELQQLVINEKISGSKATRLVKEHGGAGALKIVTEGKPRTRHTPAKKLVAAMDMAIALPDGIEFLSRYRKGEESALAEVDALFRKPKAAPKAKAPKTPKPKTVSDDDLDL